MMSMYQPSHSMPGYSSSHAFGNLKKSTVAEFDDVCLGDDGDSVAAVLLCVLEGGSDDALGTGLGDEAEVDGEVVGYVDAVGT